MKKNTWRPIIIALALILTACGNNKSFNSVAWLNADMRGRGRMAEDLVKSKILLDRTAEEALRILGKPDQNYPGVFSYQIDLGWPFKDPKHCALQVHQDGKRNVREVRIVD